MSDFILAARKKSNSETSIPWSKGRKAAEEFKEKYLKTSCQQCTKIYYIKNLRDCFSENIINKAPRDFF